MIDGGNATVFVKDMDRAVAFYTETLGLPLRFRAGNHWAEVQAGKTLVIGLHPGSPNQPAPGTAGAVQIGLSVDEPIDDVVKELTGRGVHFTGPVINDDDAGSFALFNDPDGNSLYLWQTKAAPVGEKE